MDSQHKSATFVYRAGTRHGPSFDLKDESIDKGNFSLSVYLSSSTVFFAYSRNQRLLKCVPFA